MGRLRLNRACTFSPRAFVDFARYLTRHQIDIVHAHSSAAFISLVAAASSSAAPQVVWHLHQGKLAESSHPALAMRLAAPRVAAVIAVSRPLADWAIEALSLPPSRVTYIANYVRMPSVEGEVLQLPGTPGFRIVCVGNLRPEKDTLTLLAVMSRVLQQLPQAHLLIVGGCADLAYGDRVRAEVTTRKLTNAVTLLGLRNDVPDLLRSCDVGVMSSVAEGFPLALLEYGAAGLPTVATRVGACPEILEGGRAGLLVPPSSPEDLASAIVALLRSPELRRRLGVIFRAKVEQDFGEQKIVKELLEVYTGAVSRRGCAQGGFCSRFLR